MQRVIGAAELLLVEHPRDRVQSRAPHLHRHIRGIQSGLDRLGFQFTVQVVAQYTGLLHFLFVRIQFVLHEFTGRLDDQLLFIVEREIHCCSPLA
jgi:hypothetical protein